MKAFNRTITKTQKWQQEFGGEIVKNLVNEVKTADIIILCSGRDQDLEEIFFANDIGLINHLKKSAIVVDHTTYILCKGNQDKYRIKQKKKVGFINASVSGVEAVAIGGTLSIMVCGAKNILDIDKLLSAISGGAAGSWQMKNRLDVIHQR